MTRFLLVLAVMSCSGPPMQAPTRYPSNIDPAQLAPAPLEGAGSDFPAVSMSPVVELDASGLCGFDSDAIARLEWYLAAHPRWRYAPTGSDSILGESRIAIYRDEPQPVLRMGASDAPHAQLALIVGPRPLRWAGLVWGGQHRFQVFPGPEVRVALELYQQPYSVDDPDLFSGAIVDCSPLSVAVTEVGGTERPLTRQRVAEISQELSRLKDHNGPLIELLPDGALGAANAPALRTRHRSSLTGESIQDGLDGYVNPGEPGHVEIRAFSRGQRVGQPQFPHERERVGWSKRAGERFYLRASVLRFTVSEGNLARFELWFHADAGATSKLAELCVDVNEWIEAPCRVGSP